MLISKFVNTHGQIHTTPLDRKYPALLQGVRIVVLVQLSLEFNTTFLN